MIRHLPAILTLFALALLLAGCQGRSRAHYRGAASVRVWPDGTVAIDQQARSDSVAVADPDSREASPAVAGMDGASAAAGGTWERRVDQLLSDMRVYHYAAVACGLAAIVFAVWLRQWLAAAAFALAALLAGAAPWILPTVGTVLGWIVGLVIVAGAAVLGVHLWYRWRGQQAAVKLALEGKTAEAIAAKRAADAAYDAEYRKSKQVVAAP